MELECLPVTLARVDPGGSIPKILAEVTGQLLATHGRNEQLS